MSIAEKDIDYQLAEPVTGFAQPKLAQILVLAQGDALLAKLTEQMASDAAVQGRSMRGTLSDAVNTADQPWGELDFVVFEVSDLNADLRALQALAPHDLQCVAVVRKPMVADAKTQLIEAGVAEILVVPVQDAETVKPEFQAEEAPKQSPDIASNISVILRARGVPGRLRLRSILPLGYRRGPGAEKRPLSILICKTAASVCALIWRIHPR